MQMFCVKNASAAALRALNYSPAVEKLRSVVGSSAVPLHELALAVGRGYATVFARRDCKPSHGVELLSQTDMFAAEPEGRTIRLDSMTHPERHLVSRLQVLVAGAGTLGRYELYGRSIIADDRLAGKYIGQDTLSIEFREPDSDHALFAYAFLASPTGVAAIRSASYGTKILRCRLDILRHMPIPRPDAHTTAKVAGLIRTTVHQRETYLKELRAARKLLVDRPEMQEALATCGERKTRMVAWSGALPSLHARSFAFAGEALQRLRKAWSGCLGDVLETNGAFNGPRFARVSCDPPHGTTFYSQRDPFLIRPVPRRIVVPPVPTRIFEVPPNALLVGSHGQIIEGGIFGRVELASYLEGGAGMSQDVLRLLVKPESRLLAYTFLSTWMGMRLLKSTAVGTSIPSMRLDLLLRLPFPEVEPKVLHLLTERVANAEAARVASIEAENEAIRIVEQEVLPSWLG